MWFVKYPPPGKATLPTVRRELQIVRERHDFTLDREEGNADYTVHCSCGEELDYQPDYVDRQLSKFVCPIVAESPFNDKRCGCDREWSEKDIEKMSAAQLGETFFTALKMEDEPIFKFVTKSNGVTKYTGTEEMNHPERVEYYRKAMRDQRAKAK